MKITYNEWLEKNKRRLARQYACEVLPKTETDEDRVKDLYIRGFKIVDKYYNSNFLPYYFNKFLPSHGSNEATPLTYASEVLGILKVKDVNANFIMIDKLKNKLKEMVNDLRESENKQKQKPTGFLNNAIFANEYLRKTIDETTDFIAHLEKITNNANLEKNLKVNSIKEKKLKI